MAGDAAAAPKQSATEANGKILNYMAMGLPTVCIDTPLNRALLGPLGRYVPPGDARALARELDRALEEPAAHRAALRERVATHFAWDQQVTAIEHIYDRLTARQPLEKLEPHSTPRSFASDD
jgi:glycosyltransferase involved in cell wall biosynthesis